MSSSSFFLQSVPLVLTFLVFYCVVIRPGRIAEGKRWKAVSALAGGERVVLTSGIFGTFIALHGDADGGEYEIEVADGFRIRTLEQGIKMVMTAEMVAKHDREVGREADTDRELPRKVP